MLATNVIRDSVAEALERRMMGASTFESGVPLLDNILALQFRLYYHLSQNNGISQDVGRVLMDQCKKMEATADQTVTLAQDPATLNLATKILVNCKCIILFYLADYDTSMKLLDENFQAGMARSEKGSVYHDFHSLLDLENLYYKAKITGNPLIHYQKLLQVIDYIPKKSYGYVYYYLQLIALELNAPSLENLFEKFKSRNPLIAMMYVEASRDNDTDLDTEQPKMLQYCEEILSRAKFPRANESNDTTLDQVHIVLQKFLITLNHKPLPQWKTFIISSMAKTFQSITVSKTAMIYFMLNGEIKESILNFVNLEKYTKRDYALNENRFDDIVSLIESYNFILNKTKPSNSIRILFQFETCLENLLKLLLFLYKDLQFPITNNPKDCLNYASTAKKIVIPKNVAITLFSSWKVIYDSHSTELQFLQSGDLVSYICNAMSLLPKKEMNLEIQFQYAYTLACMREIESCITFLQDHILNDHPTFYRAWHLLALCHSVQEDKQDSYKIVCSVIESMVTDAKTLTDEDKWQLISMKCTQLCLIDEIFGTSDALEMVVDLFELYHDLYDSSPETTADDTSSTRCKEYLLQNIWLMVADFYMRKYEQETSLLDPARPEVTEEITSLLKEAENAVAEVSKINSPKMKNINCNVHQSRLSMLEKDWHKALGEVENVLYYDDVNVGAIVGFAELIVPESEQNVELETELSMKGLSAKTDLSKAEEVFANDTDKSAAYARLKLLLECSIRKSIDAYYSAEIWWYLSLIYERYRSKQYKDALLTCIRNKETTPIREFKHCKY
ncbi:Ypp1p KNAG_0G00820 [Huiozyma naganishii CBS 8797]|uniref:Cargo-transport protein YPP1 n=1 Tax=Huiozyma naganishii (strain ATCC MYA-139 / BCRC 22969 / CBS 8797 / KCTC 17520 / NBRC 10181 / NCYC 3082 / Yp74L-3) TaxID=1071383 RepID=J7RNK3_HUIN7|nr:hypothetical protein KNAG_0G00820 [Kazachstania naganishii CBS 8797]CCK71138.1 hypothetical protein KNAG_0G00820 [Kazachstania naganishii CBS 8797]